MVIFGADGAVLRQGCTGWPFTWYLAWCWGLPQTWSACLNLLSTGIVCAIMLDGEQVSLGSVEEGWYGAISGVNMTIRANYSPVVKGYRPDQLLGCYWSHPSMKQKCLNESLAQRTLDSLASTSKHKARPTSCLACNIRNVWVKLLPHQSHSK